MKVFVPYFDAALDPVRSPEAAEALRGAALVPFRHEYPILRIQSARPSDPLPEPGEAQIISPRDWAAAAGA